MGIIIPNRFIKEGITTSENIDMLSPQAEVLFYRLLVSCDDFGLMFAKSSIVKSKCFPNRVDKIKDKDIEKWLHELVDAGLIFLYSYEDRLYLKMTKWEKHQQTRAAKSKYPLPTLDGVEIVAIKTEDNDELIGENISMPIKIIKNNKKISKILVIEEKNENSDENFQNEEKIEEKIEVTLKNFENAPNIIMTITEYEKLLQYIGNKKLTDNYIENLSDYILKIGKDKYKSHYATIRTWYRRDFGDISTKIIKNHDPTLFYGDSPPDG